MYPSGDTLVFIVEKSTDKINWEPVNVLDIQKSHQYSVEDKRPGK